MVQNLKTKKLILVAFHFLVGVSWSNTNSHSLCSFLLTQVESPNAQFKKNEKEGGARFLAIADSHEVKVAVRYTRLNTKEPTLHLDLDASSLRGVDVNPDQMETFSKAVTALVRNEITSHPNLRAVTVDFSQETAQLMTNELQHVLSYWNIETQKQNAVLNSPSSRVRGHLLEAIKAIPMMLALIPVGALAGAYVGCLLTGLTYVYAAITGAAYEMSQLRPFAFYAPVATGAAVVLIGIVFEGGVGTLLNILDSVSSSHIKASQITKANWYVKTKIPLEEADVQELISATKEE